MTTEEFEVLINQGESEILDFKKEQYDIIKSNEDNTAKLVKDIISLANTIRKKTAYIIIGIEDSSSGKVLHGLNKNIDDAIFQDKIKSKVYPIPKFSYLTINYKGTEFGIIEVPLNRYEEPISPIVKMKGLEVGKIYIRRGSTNSEAIGKEILQINKWIQTVELDIDIKTGINDLLAEINSGSSKLSYCISKALKIANDTNNEELVRFCKGELMGWYGDNVDLIESNLPTHRMTKVMASMYQIKNVAIERGTTFINQLKEDDKFREIDFVVQDSITEIESTINKFPSNGFLTLNRKLGDIAPNAPSPRVPIFIYCELDTFTLAYDRTKTELTKKLIKLRG